MTKAIIDFTGYPGPDLLPVGQAIHDAMTAAAATFPTPPVTMANLQLLLDDYKQKLTDKSSGATADTIAFNISSNNLENALGDIGGYVNIVAKATRPSSTPVASPPMTPLAHPSPPRRPRRRTLSCARAI